MIAQRIIEIALCSLTAAQSWKIASQTLCEEAERFSGKTLSIQSFENEVVVVFFCVFYDQAIAEDGNEINGVSTVAELLEKFLDMRKSPLSFLHYLFDFNDVQLHSSLIQENLFIPLRKRSLLLDVNEA